MKCTDPLITPWLYFQTLFIVTFSDPRSKNLSKVVRSPPNCANIFLLPSHLYFVYKKYFGRKKIFDVDLSVEISISGTQYPKSGLEKISVYIYLYIVPGMLFLSFN